MGGRTLVVGASGFIGRHLVARLSGSGIPVVVCARNAAILHRLFPGIPVIAADLACDDQAAWRRRLDDIDGIVNAAGIVRNGPSGTLEAVHTEGPARLFRACL